MAINPIRVGELQLPANPRPPALDFSGLASLGDAIGQYRLRDQIASLTVTDPATGAIDYDKTSANLARAGLLREAEPLVTQGYRQQTLTRQQAADKALADYHRQLLEQQGTHIFQEEDKDELTGKGLGTYHYKIIRPQGGTLTEPAAKPAPTTTPGPGASLQP